MIVNALPERNWKPYYRLAKAIFDEECSVHPEKVSRFTQGMKILMSYKQLLIAEAIENQTIIPLDFKNLKNKIKQKIKASKLLNDDGFALTHDNKADMDAIDSYVSGNLTGISESSLYQKYADFINIDSYNILRSYNSSWILFTFNPAYVLDKEEFQVRSQIFDEML